MKKRLISKLVAFEYYKENKDYLEENMMKSVKKSQNCAIMPNKSGMVFSMSVLLAFAFMFCATSVYGADYVEARVVSYEPVYYDVVNRRPTRVCKDVLVQVREDGPIGGRIGKTVDRKYGSVGGLVGAVTGGLLGSRIGGGSGKTLSTATGVIVGAHLGDGISRKRKETAAEYVTTNQCATVFVEDVVKRVDYYRVVVEVDGVLTTANSRRIPSETMMVLY
jgi:uncharacterized protein YcfJ